jgi:hypothetical protein
VPGVARLCQHHHTNCRGLAWSFSWRYGSSLLDPDRHGQRDDRLYFSAHDEYLAYIELNIAARTDEELRQSFDPKAIAFDQLWLDRALELLPHWKGNRDGARLAWNFGRAMLEGLKINERIVTSERDRQAIRQKLISAMTLMEKGDL